MTTVRRVAAAVALVLATVLALLAHAVLSVGGARGDSSRSHALLAPLAKHLVPAQSSDGAQQAVQDLLDHQGGLGSILRRHAESRAILAKLAASGRPADRSWAANLLGAAAMQDSALDRSNATSYIEQALTAFRQAIHAGAGNEEPKFNLELLLTLNRMGRTAQRPSPQPQRRNSKRASAHHREAGFGY